MNELIEYIRAIEAKHSIEPCTLRKQKDGRIRVTLNKAVLYQTANTDVQSRWRQFKDWIHSRDVSFDEKIHAKLIQDRLNAQTAADPSLGVTEVTVVKKNKLLPIPYFDIPIPFWKQSGTRVRGYSDLAVQNVQLTFTLPKNIEPLEAARKILTAAVLSQGVEDNRQLEDAALRISWNPVRWILHGLAYLVPKKWARKINRVIPNRIIKASRLNSWGSLFCTLKLNPPTIGSGLLAGSLNVATVTAVAIPLAFFCVAINAGGPFGGPGNCLAGPNPQMNSIHYGNSDSALGSSRSDSHYPPDQRPHEKIKLDLDKTSYWSPFFQTNVKIERNSPRYYFEENVDSNQKTSFQA